jgi:hypothetical protein
MSQALPEPMVDPELLNNVDANAMQQEHNIELVNYLNMAMTPEMTEMSVDDYSTDLLQYLHYVRGHRVLRQRADLPLLICGEKRHAKTDACLYHALQHNICFIQENKRLGQTGLTDVPAQLVAEAVAAFNANNVARKAAGQPPLAAMVSYFVMLMTLH